MEEQPRKKIPHSVHEGEQGHPLGPISEQLGPLCGIEEA